MKREIEIEALEEKNSVSRDVEKRRQIIEEIKQAFIEGKLTKRELGYTIMQRLGISQGPAYALRKKDSVGNFRLNIKF